MAKVAKTIGSLALVAAPAVIAGPVGAAIGGVIASPPPDAQPVPINDGTLRLLTKLHNTNKIRALSLDPIERKGAASEQLPSRFVSVGFGECMLPAVEHGGFVIVDKTALIEPGDLVYLEFAKQRFVKRFVEADRSVIWFETTHPVHEQWRHARSHCQAAFKVVEVYPKPRTIRERLRLMRALWRHRPSGRTPGMGG